MTARRADTSSDSSLELLLDTVCNTFGGILFISMLVVVLLSTTAPVRDLPPDKSQELKLLRSEMKRSQATEELNRLRKSVAEQKAIAEFVAPNKTLVLAREVQAKKADRTRLVTQKSRLVGDLSKIQQQINHIARDATDRQTKLAAAKQRVAAIRRKLKDVVIDRSRKAIIPKVEITLKPTKPCFLRDGKLFGPNLNEYTMVVRNRLTHVEPKPGSGLQVDINGKNKDELARKLGVIPASNYVVKLFVWPDSYGHFVAVRDVLIKLGLKVDLVPMKEKEPVVLGASSAPTRAS